jgi:hypothetical protein
MHPSLRFAPVGLTTLSLALFTTACGGDDGGGGGGKGAEVTDQTTVMSA